MRHCRRHHSSQTQPLLVAWAKLRPCSLARPLVHWDQICGTMCHSLHPCRLRLTRFNPPISLWATYLTRQLAPVMWTSTLPNHLWARLRVSIVRPSRRFSGSSEVSYHWWPGYQTCSLRATSLSPSISRCWRRYSRRASLIRRDRTAASHRLSRKICKRRSTNLKSSGMAGESAS